jgi:hypothetical protein
MSSVSISAFVVRNLVKTVAGVGTPTPVVPCLILYHAGDHGSGKFHRVWPEGILPVHLPCKPQRPDFAMWRCHLAQPTDLVQSATMCQTLAFWYAMKIPNSL